MQALEVSYKQAVRELRDDVVVSLSITTPGTEHYDKLLKELEYLDNLYKDIKHDVQLIPGVSNELLFNGLIFLGSLGVLVVFQNSTFVHKNLLSAITGVFLKLKK